MAAECTIVFNVGFQPLENESLMALPIPLTADMCRVYGGDKNPLMLCPVRNC